MEEILPLVIKHIDVIEKTRPWTWVIFKEEYKSMVSNFLLEDLDKIKGSLETFNETFNNQL